MYIFCVGNCICIVLGCDVEVVECVIEDNVLVFFQQNVYYWLILYGCYVCQVKCLCCKICFIEDFCFYEEKIE